MHATVTAILSALPEEQQGLLAQLSGARRVQRAGRDFWHGRWQDHEVVLALSRIGKVAAATTATTLIEALGVGRMLFTGVAGGLGASVAIGDVVVARDFVQHDMDASPLFARFEVPLYGRSVWPCDARLHAVLVQASQDMLRDLAPELLHAADGANTRMPVVHQGLVASGDRFVSKAAEASALHSDLQAAGMEPLAVEMEGAAVAQVCHDYGIPFGAVRTVSDRADDTAAHDFQRFVTQVASRYALRTLAHSLRLLPPL